MEKQLLTHGDVVFATGVFLKWDDKEKDWIVCEFEDDAYFNGDIVEGIGTEEPYIEITKD